MPLIAAGVFFFVLGVLLVSNIMGFTEKFLSTIKRLSPTAITAGTTPLRVVGVLAILNGAIGIVGGFSAYRGG